MKKKVSKILCLVLALCTVLSVGVMAAEPDSKSLTVRVNGEAVAFPDAKLYMDENSRTMIPVRFVTESLGASVTWNETAQTAVISKDGITVKIKIGDTNLSVTQNGKTETVRMDTAAVIRDGRTYVPIRFVAEALGAYVDYSNYFRTIGIFDGELTASEISTLQGYAYTVPAGGRTYAQYKAYVSSGKKTNADLVQHYGLGRESFTSFANAREFLYGLDDAAYYKAVIQAAKKCIAYTSANLTITLKADESCIYQPDSYSGITCAVRGIAVVHLKENWKALTNSEIALCSKLGVYDLSQSGVDLCVPVDIHMNTVGTDGSKATLNTITPLAEQYSGGTK